MIRPKHMALVTTILLIAAILTIALTSPVKAQEPAQETYNGVGSVTYTGDAYPTSIVLAGYDVEGSRIWLNIVFYTTNTLTNEKGNWTYKVEIFDATSNLIGSYEAYVIGDVNATTVSVADLEISLTTTLTAEFKIVVTVTDFTKVAA